MYKPSIELKSILIENGFTDKCYLYVAEKDLRYKQTSTYDPNRHRKVFGYGKGKRKLEFRWNCTDMVVVDRTLITGEFDDGIDEQKLKCIITYFKMSHYIKESIKCFTGYRIELCAELLEKFKMINSVAHLFIKNLWKYMII